MVKTPENPQAVHAAKVDAAVDALFAEIDTRVDANNPPANGYRMGVELFSAVRARLQDGTAEDLSEFSNATPLTRRGVRLLYSTRWAGQLEWVEVT